MKKFFLGSMTGIVLTMFAWTYALRYIIVETVVAVLDGLLREHQVQVKYHRMSAQQRTREEHIRAARAATHPN